MPPTGIDWSALPWDDIIPRLLLFAHRRTRRTSFSGMAMSPNDLVGDAIEKTMSGVRRWEPTDRSLFDHLAGVINSSLYNEIRKIVSRSEVPLDETILEGIKTDAPSPEDEAAYKSEVAELLRFVRARNPELLEMLSAALFFDSERPADMAEVLGISIKDAYAGRAKLRRLLHEYSGDTAKLHKSS
jgi:DNA-directed RNA polymerase specialized sigma24 family protein